MQDTRKETVKEHEDVNTYEHYEYGQDYADAEPSESDGQ